MSMAKRQLEQIEDYRSIAYKTMVEIGAIKTCEMHDDFYYITHQFDENTIYAMVTAKLKNEYGKTQDYKLFQKQIHEILSYAADGVEECPYCEKLEKE